MEKNFSDKSNLTIFFYRTKKDIGSGAFVYCPIWVLDVSIDTHDGAATFLFRQNSEMTPRGRVGPPFFGGVPLQIPTPPRILQVGGCFSHML